MNIALMMEAANASETSVKFHQTKRRNNAEDSHIFAPYLFLFLSFLLFPFLPFFSLQLTTYFLYFFRSLLYRYFISCPLEIAPLTIYVSSIACSFELCATNR
jgi:hypothetical protein